LAPTPLHGRSARLSDHDISFLPVILSNRSKKKRVFDEKSGSFYPLICRRLLTKVAAINRLRYRKVLWIGVGDHDDLFAASASRMYEVNGRVFDDVGDGYQF
jgi:uncharacterized protein